MIINGYVLDGDLKNEDSGFSKWAFCNKNGKEYFIKEFLAPTYPVDKSKMTEKQAERKLKECKKFENRLLEMYRVINKVSDGNVVRIQEFFRCNSKYYIVTEKINHSGMSIDEISKLPYHAIKFICKVITHAMLRLHNEGFVHADIKPNNVLVTADEYNKKYTEKIIDFDCGFFGTEPPEPGEELNGDPIHFAPEMLLHMMEEDVALSCKIDVFALGVLFHQYMTGKQPLFDTTKYDYAAEAILDDSPIRIDESIPSEFANILRKMLVKEPFERISLQEVYDSLSYKKKIETVQANTNKFDFEELDSNIKIYKGNKN